MLKVPPNEQARPISSISNQKFLADPLITEASPYLAGRIRIGIIGNRNLVLDHIYLLQSSPFLSLTELMEKDIDGSSSNLTLANLHCLILVVSKSKDLRLLRIVQWFPYKVIFADDEMLHETMLRVRDCRIRAIFDHRSASGQIAVPIVEILKTAVVGLLLKSKYLVHEEIFFLLADQGFTCINNWLKGIRITRRRLEQLNRLHVYLSPFQTLTLNNGLLYALRITIGSDEATLNNGHDEMDHGRRCLKWIIENWSDVNEKVFGRSRPCR